MASIFFSYSHADQQFAQGLAEALRGYGHEPWLGETQLAYGDSLIDRTQDALRAAAAVVVLLSENSKNSQWVSFELGAATAQGKRIFPVVLSDDPGVVPIQIRSIVYLRATSHQPASVAKSIHEALKGEV